MMFLASVQMLAPPAAPSRRMTLVDCAPYYKDAMLGRFYAICNCCSCCCGAMEAQRNGTPMIASSGYVAVVDEDLCECGDLRAEWHPSGTIRMGAILIQQALGTLLTKYMDAVYQQAIADRFDQVAILGAGFDTRVLRFPVVDDRTKSMNLILGTLTRPF